MDSKFFRHYSNLIAEADGDMLGQICKKCRRGKYQETSIHDDWDGVLHCNKCGDQVKRHAQMDMSIFSKGAFDPSKRTPEEHERARQMHDYEDTKQKAFKDLGLDQHQWDVFELTWDYCHATRKN